MAKNLGIVSRTFHAIKLVLSICLGIFFPFTIITNTLYVLQIDKSINEVLGTISVVILIIVPLIINSVMVLRSLCVVFKNDVDSASEGKRAARQKTIILLVLNIVFALNFLIEVATFGWNGELFDVIMIRKYMSLGVEILVSILSLAFLQNKFIY
jgi:hypothetical protein